MNISAHAAAGRKLKQVIIDDVRSGQVYQVTAVYRDLTTKLRGETATLINETHSTHSSHYAAFQAADELARSEKWCVITDYVILRSYIPREIEND
jgi:hypothetical protein